MQFVTEFGDIDMMSATTTTMVSQVDDDYYSETIKDIYVYERVKGTGANLECGGTDMGVCDRLEGVCQCVEYQGSSNASNAPGESSAFIKLLHLMRRTTSHEKFSHIPLIYRPPDYGAPHQEILPIGGR